MEWESNLAWILFYGLWVATNHFQTGTALLCYGKCFESEDDPTSHPKFPRLGENAPRCTLDRKMKIPCNKPGYNGCMKTYTKVEEPTPMEFVLYGCDRSELPPGWFNDSKYETTKSPFAYWKCTSELCNLPSDKYTQPSATAVSNSNTQAPSPSTESPAFGKIGILLPIANAMNFNWTGFINTMKSFKF